MSYGSAGSSSSSASPAGTGTGTGSPDEAACAVGFQPGLGVKPRLNLADASDFTAVLLSGRSPAPVGPKPPPLTPAEEAARRFAHMELLADRRSNSPGSPAASIPMFPELPDAEAAMATLNLFFSAADVVCPTLHRSRFFSSNPPLLLITSMLLAAPYITPEPIPGARTRRELVERERALFGITARELEGALGGGQGGVGMVAAVAVLANWALYKGLRTLGRRFLSFAHILAWRAKIVAGPCTFGSPTDVSWDELAMVAYGSDYMTRPMDAATIAQMRELWIDYWTRERIACSMLKLALIFPSDPDLNTSANEDEPNFAPDSLCGRRSHPMPDVWEASFAPDFDPRSYTRTDGARETDLYSWMAMDRMEPARFAALGRLHDNIVNQRIGFDVIYSVLRHRIRDFKAACRANGFTTPAELPAELPVADGPVSPALAQLILQRDALDADISDFWNAHPIVIRQAFERGSVGEMVELFMRSAGSFWIAFARIPRVCSVPLMRLEVWSSFGCYLGPLGSENSIDILADEFSGGGMFVEFLELAVQATRVLESWIGLNPRLQYYIGSGRTVFRLLCLHVATLERLKRLGAAMDEERMVIAAAEHDVRVCLNILDRLSTKGSWMRPLAKLARKIANGEHVTDVDVDEGVGRVDLPEEEDPALAEEEAKLMKVLAVFRHKLRSCK